MCVGCMCVCGCENPNNKVRLAYCQTDTLRTLNKSVHLKYIYIHFYNYSIVESGTLHEDVEK